MIGEQIAVLEGGYSVQEALPYVNLGIILSMAGLDYSRVIEPSFDFNRYKESKVVMDQIDDIIYKWKLQWANRERIQRETLASIGDFWRERRNVYYDESGIREERDETIRLYPNEPGRLGWHSVLSSGRGGPYGPQSVYTMFLPWQRDKACKREAYDVALKAKREGKAQRYVMVDPLGVGQQEL